MVLTGRKAACFRGLAGRNRCKTAANYTEYAQGIDPQALAGHKDAATTAIYRDVRNSEWVMVKAG